MDTKPGRGAAGGEASAGVLVSRTQAGPRVLDATAAGDLRLRTHDGRGSAIDATMAGNLVLREPASEPQAIDATAAGDLLLRSHGGATRDREASLPGEGDRVGRFVVLRELGRGAMGVVFAGYDEELARRVALKLLHFDPQLDASAGRSQLLREAQALARLTHPNVVAVYEAGVWRGSVYVAMEYVHGVDLQAWLAAATRPWREVLTVLRQAGEGLLAAHRSALVHRDFKPSNVLVGDDGRARVADFGLAAGRGEPTTGESVSVAPTLLTSTIAGAGALVGTPAYMAPEQIRRTEVTALSDQFAFCVTLHEALYGARPFQAADFAGLAAAIEHDDPEIPADASVPAWIGPLLLRGLAKDPARRFPSLAELLVELARDPEAERARRRRLALQLLATAALTVVMIVGGIRLYGVIVHRAAERRADARLEQLREQWIEARAHGDPAKADRLLEAFVEYPDNRGTAAVPRAYREHAAQLADPAAAVDAFAGAYLTATDRDDEIAALRGLIPRLISAGRHLGAGAALATLDRRAPELAADPELALARRTAALRSRDLPTAAAALATFAAGDPTRTYGQVLENMSHATAVTAAQLGGGGGQRLGFIAADLDGDCRSELSTAGPQGPGSFALTTGAGGLSSLGVVRGEPGDSEMYLLPHALAGTPMAIISGPGEDLAVDRQHRLVDLLADGGTVTRLTWTDSKLRTPAVADLDGDGEREIYVGSGAYARRLSRIDRGPDGVWRRGPVHPLIDRISSDVNAVIAGDLDGDGGEELIVALGAWRAFDLRVLRGGPDGAIEQLARKTTGLVSALGLVRVGDEMWIAALKRDENASVTRFSASAPYGPPAGIYLFALRQGALVEVGFFPSRPPELASFEAPLLVTDLDGDGHDDLVARANAPDDPEFHLAVLRQHAGGFLPPLLIRGIEPHVLLAVDGDPARELLVGGQREQPGEYFVLGLGDAMLPPLPVTRSEPRPLPATVDDPTLAAAWRHAEEMVEVGLNHRSAVELAGLAGLAGHVREDLLFRSGELHALANEHAVAAERFIAAAQRPDLADQALAGAIRSRRALGEIAAEAVLVARRGALPGLSPDDRRAAGAELDRLRRATAPRPQLVWTFDRPLDPHWRIDDPLALTREPASGALHMHSALAGRVAHLPLRHDGGTFGVVIEIEVDRAEWGSALEVTLRGAEVYSGVRVFGEGSVEAPDFVYRGLHPHDAVTLPRVPAGRIRLEHTIYPELALQTVTLVIPGAPTQRHVRPLAAALAPGAMTLELVATSKSPLLVGRARIHRLELHGLELDEWTGPDPQQASARAIVEGELTAALASLPATGALAPGDLRLLSRSGLLARLGDLDGAAAALRRGLDVPKDRPFHGAFMLQLHATRGPWQLVVDRVLGPRVVQSLYDVTALSHPWRPEAVGDALARLATWPREPIAGGDAGRLYDQALALIVRGEAWRRFGRADLARPDLDAAAAIMTRPGLEVPRLMLDELQQRRLELTTRTGDRALALALMTAMIREALSPEIRLERFRGREELATLLRPEDWAALETVVAVVAVDATVAVTRQ